MMHNENLQRTGHTIFPTGVGSPWLLFYRVVFHPLAHVPGPFWAKVSGLWRSSRYFRGTWHDDILDVHRKYGRVARIAPDEISVVDGTVMKRLFGHGNNAIKSHWYSGWEPPNLPPNLFPTRDKDLHARLKKRVAGAYSNSAVLRAEKYIQDCLDLMMKVLHKCADQEDTINMTEITNALTYDLAGEFSFGEPMGHLRTGTDVMNLRSNISIGFFILSTLSHFPGQARILKNSFTATLRIPNPLESFVKWGEDKVKRRMDHADEASRSDMLSHFISVKNDKGEAPSLLEVLTEAVSSVGAGADSNAIGMRACLYYICKRKDVYEKFQREIDDYYESNGLTGPATYLQTQQMPYVVAVCKEAIRLHPSIVFQLIRIAPDDISVEGIRIPANTEVSISPLAHNRDPDIFGPDADEFRPERWTEDPQRARYMDSLDMSFGGNGPRTCIGRNIALVEIYKFIVQLFRNFDVGLANPENPWHITSHWIAAQHDMHMWIKARPKSRPKE